MGLLSTLQDVGTRPSTRAASIYGEVVSVVRRQTSVRWAAVALGALLLLGVPTVASAVLARVDGSAPAPAPDLLVTRILGSTRVGYEGLAQARGSLGLPDLPRLGAVSALLGDTTRMRVWWSGPHAWRVAVLTGTGEHDTYGTPRDLVTWDYEAARLTSVFGTASARLPRADDLLPPQAARRLLAGVGPGDRVRALAGRRVAGTAAAGLRVVPGDRRSTLDHVDVWADPRSGLPLALLVVDRRGGTVLDSRFTQLSPATPPARALRPPDPPGAVRDSTSLPDIAADVDQFAPWRLPASLAGLRASSAPLAGVATYGRGLVRVVVVPLPRHTAEDVSSAALRTGARPQDVAGGRALLVGSSALDVLVACGDDGRHAYLVAGLVSAPLLRRAVAALFADPPPRRLR